MNENRSQVIARNAIFLYIRMIFVLIIGLYLSRVILQTLGVEDFGIYNLVGSVVIFLNFLQAALHNATSRYLTYELGVGNVERLKTVYSMAINCHVILAVGLVIIMELAGVWFLNNHLNISKDRIVAANWLFQFSLFTFAISIVRTPFMSNVIAHERMDFYAVVSIGEALLKLLSALSISYFSDKLIAYGGLLLLVAISISVAYLVYCIKELKDTRFSLLWDKQLVKSFSSYSGWSLFVNGADLCTQQSITIFFNWFIGIVGNAALGVMNQVNAGLNLFVSNFCQAFNPQLIKSYANKEYSYFLKLIYSSSKISYILFIVVALPISFNLDFILRFWLGEYPVVAIDFVIATLIYQMVDSLQSPLFQSVHATGYIKVHHIIVGTLKFLTIPAIYLTLRIGMTGSFALFVWSLSNIVVSTARVIYMRSLIKLDVRLYLKDVILPLLILTIIIIVANFGVNQLVNNEVLRLSLDILITVAVIVISNFFVFNKDEKKIISAIPVVQKTLGRFKK